MLAGASVIVMDV